MLTLKRILVFFSLTLYTLHIYAQDKWDGKGSSIVFYNGLDRDSLRNIINNAKYTLPIEGGAYIPVIDSISSLQYLINKFNGDWKFIPTYKMYWIGYTDYMFSVAARGNDAIPVLINFVDTSKNQHAQEGAIYTLHLIGINGIIAGRFGESF